MTDNLNVFFSDNAQWVDSSDDTSFNSAMPPQPPKSRRDMRRRREQKRRRLYITIIAALVVVILIGVGGFSGVRALKRWKAANEANSQSQIEDYTGPGDKEVTFTVESGQGAAEIAENLVKAKIVKSAAAFTSAVSGAAATLYPGSYALKTHMKASDVVKILSDQSQAGGFAEIRAGERVSDVIANAAQASGIDVSEFQAIIDGGGSGILPEEAGGKFEGWLEPGTYNAQNKSAEDIIKSMVDARIAKLDDLGVPTGSERERILIIASIAESEVGSDKYYGQVARVILNRIDSDMALGMDTTVAYGLGISASRLTDDQLNDDSNPYNTRIHKGLTPTPISNPGDDAIKASINPPEGKWMYFVTTNLQTGETKFVETEDEFWKIRDEYKNNNENAN
ncbi:endolytic transglycosylase MltG [Bifidobacterium catenulatum]|uniref:endolytic transglycosylase MltG n=1 Tax=Bifidobacterium catenulatum TaxID=1686 RepID=UPI0012601F47|nr:endolytic transglycosylase MltG [Bifidobacterium catenulatum]KAB7456178.1 endolytic transglycosylase MltG [Bifidobacterium catenulatum]KAB7464372.1 endolytic transglycosylase MltG [Bifidobacterium catenulatum]